MKRNLFAVGAVLLSAMVAYATDFDRYEVFAGYSFVRFHPNSGCSVTPNCGSFLPNFNANGGSGQFVYNFKDGLGVALDLGAVTKGELNQTAIDTTVFNFVAGPRYTFRHHVFHESRFQPFVQALFGGAYSTASTHVDILGSTIVNPLPPGLVVNPNLPISARLVGSHTGFAMLAGGGLDIKLKRHISLRPVGADYYLTRMPNFLTQSLPGVPHNHHNSNNFRYTAGVNFLFGREK
jgi:hypothetical protein